MCEAEFDAIFSHVVLHWIHDHPRVLLGVRRALRPGGRFVAEFGAHGNIGAVATAMRSVLQRYDVDHHLPWNFPSESTFRAQLHEAGLHVTRWEIERCAKPLPSGMDAWLKALGGAMINRLPPNKRKDARQEVIDLLAPTLRDPEGNWHVDCVRIRVRAEK